MSDTRHVECLLRDLPDARVARSLIRKAVSEWGFDGVADDAMQVAHELCVNGLTHGRSECRLRAFVDGDGIRVEVEDANERIPVVALGPVEALSGRGLPLVAALADDWGVESTVDGKVVWARFGPHRHGTGLGTLEA